jgi:hypothetical protein
MLQITHTAEIPKIFRDVARNLATCDLHKELLTEDEFWFVVHVRLTQPELLTRDMADRLDSIAKKLPQ